jgi:hypothetical protein
MLAISATDLSERADAIVRDLRSYADSGMEPVFAAKLRAAAEEIERRLSAKAGETGAA